MRVALMSGLRLVLAILLSNYHLSNIFWTAKSRNPVSNSSAAFLAKIIPYHTTLQSTSRRSERPSSGDSPRRKLVTPPQWWRPPPAAGGTPKLAPATSTVRRRRAASGPGGSGGASLRSPWTSGAAGTDGRLGSDWLVWPLIEVWCLSRPTGRGSGRRRGTAVPELRFSVFFQRVLWRGVAVSAAYE
jgi:hypothetical protein